MIIDAAQDLLRYHEGFKYPPSPSFATRERDLLLARAANGAPPQPVAVSAGIGAPERGHATLRIGVGAGVASDGGTFETFAVRPALHDDLDPPEGYPDGARLAMLAAAIRFENRAQRLVLDRIDGLEIRSAVPLERWIHRRSWNVRLGADSTRELGCSGSHCLVVGARVGAGIAARLGPGGRALGFAFAESDAGAGPALAGDHAYRLGLGGSTGVVAGISRIWRSEIDLRYIHYMLGDTRRRAILSVGQSLSLSRAAAIRASLFAGGAYAEAALALLGYF